MIVSVTMNKLYHHFDSTTTDIFIEDRDRHIEKRLICGESIQGFFDQYIQARHSGIADATYTTLEEKNVVENYMFFYKKISTLTNGFDLLSDKKEQIKKLRKKIEELVIIHMQIHNEEIAYEIFESTNARGLDLNVADLVKNLIFKNLVAVSGDKTKTKNKTEERWQYLVSNIEDTGTEVKKFLRYYWISKFEFVTEKKLYKAIKRQVTDWQLFFDELVAASEDYYLLLNGTKSDWKNANLRSYEKLYNASASIKAMNVTQCYVFMLSMLRNGGRISFRWAYIFKAIEVFSFLYSAVSKQPGNRVERVYARFARELDKKANDLSISDDEIKQILDNLKQRLADEIPGRELFLELFGELRYKRSSQGISFIKYVLTKFDTYYNPKGESFDSDTYNIEHVLPQTPHSDWELTKKDIKDYVNLLGNLTLLGSKLNSEAANKIIPLKIAKYEESKLPITENLIFRLKHNDLQWNEECIIDRQKEMAELAYDVIWKI